MANSQSAHPGHTRTVVHKPLPGHSSSARKVHPGRTTHPAAASHETPAPPKDDSPADLAALAIYVWHGKFDRIKLGAGFTEQFRKDAHFDISAIPHMELLIGFMEDDTSIIDIRWMAYMLATAYKETTTRETETVPVLDKHGKPRVDKKGSPLVRSRTQWLITMSPVDEVGHGANRKYYLPVKVKLLPTGEARITEQDGDQFSVTAKGNETAITRGAKMGVPATQKTVKSYLADDGTELKYFGRGYVQLTWWSHYAKSGAQLGLGLQLLLDPDQVLQPEIAYKLMARGMRTGESFANGKKFTDYFHGSKTDYINARRMVNGVNCATEIAGIAKKFETILLAAKS